MTFSIFSTEDVSARADALRDLAPHLPLELLDPIWSKVYGRLMRAVPLDATRRLLERIAPVLP